MKPTEEKPINSSNSVDTDQLDNMPELKVKDPTPTPTPSFSLETDTTGQEITKDKEQAKSELDKLQEAFGLKSEKEQSYRDEFGASKSLETYNKYKNEIAKEERNLENRRRSIFSQGLTEEQAKNFYDAEERVSLEKQADKAILGNAALGDYNTAKQNAKDKVDLEFAPLEAKLTQAQETYEEWKDLYTDFEKKKIESQFRTQEADITSQRNDRLKANEMYINALSLEAPQSVLSKALELINKGAKSSDVASVLGKYSGDFYKVELLKEQIETERASRNKIVSETGAGKPATQAQSTAAGFASRVVQSKDIIDANSAELSKLSVVEYMAQRNLPNTLQSPLVQQQLQAERNFINAVLRRESGAAISPEEFKSAEKQYFPMPGDSAEVLAQKKANRDLTSTNLINESGNAYVAPQTSNKFSMSLGKTGESIQGTAIVQSVSPDGTINFSIPTKEK